MIIITKLNKKEASQKRNNMYGNMTQKRHDYLMPIAVAIIEQIIEPLHYPQRGLNGEKYYEMEDRICELLDKNVK